MEPLYDKTIGYAHLNLIDEDKAKNILRINKEIIENYHKINSEDTLLVAGAGNGIEAILLCNLMNIKTFAVDINIDVNLKRNNAQIIFSRQNLSNLTFKDDEFDIVYCVHVLEHVDDEVKVLKELKRILKPTGVLFIGFPNKNRLIGYLGTNAKTTLVEKIKWNSNDYIFRLKGKYENRFGAHAGFTEKEFYQCAGSLYSKVYPVRNDYMERKYQKFDRIIKILVKTGLSEIAFPSNYFICIE
jgi:ubiquinone/menaquinone biosynthesis C-methylase UbiE